MKIIYLPIENLEQRYTVMMNDTVKPLIDVYVYPNISMPDKIQQGEFLDVFHTCRFKAAQLKMVSDMFATGKVFDGDAFFFADIFFPGLEMIPYMAELAGIKVKIYGFNHAGRADENDFVQKLRGWADDSERAWHEICHRVYVGSDYHRGNVIRKFDLPNDKVMTTGAIWNENWVKSVYWNEKEEKADYIIWPHRICKEKDYDLFLRIAKYNRDYKFIVTMPGNATEPTDAPPNVNFIRTDKKSYYKLLSKSKWYLSTAIQETFGYTLQEAMFYDCKIIVPDRACYPNMVSKGCRYSVDNHTESTVRKMLVNDETLGVIRYRDYNNNVSDIIKDIRTS